MHIQDKLKIILSIRKDFLFDFISLTLASKTFIRKKKLYGELNFDNSPLKPIFGL
jgi:hypothetical protein